MKPLTSFREQGKYDSSLSDESRPAAEIVDSAWILPRFRHLCPHTSLKLMEILTRPSLPSFEHSKSYRLL